MSKTHKKKTQEQNAFSNEEGNTRDSERDLTTRQKMAQQSPRMGASDFMALLSCIFYVAQL